MNDKVAPPFSKRKLMQKCARVVAQWEWRFAVRNLIVVISAGLDEPVVLPFCVVDGLGLLVFGSGLFGLRRVIVFRAAPVWRLLA